MASLRARAQRTLGPALFQALPSVCSASLLELAGANARRCSSRRRGEIHGRGEFSLLLRSNANPPHPWISPLHLLLHFLALETWFALVCLLLRHLHIFFPGTHSISPSCEMRPLLLSSLLRLDHFSFLVFRDLSSTARLRTRRDLMSLLLTKILLLTCLPSPCSSSRVTPAACVSFGSSHEGAGEKLLFAICLCRAA